MSKWPCPWRSVAWPQVDRPAATSPSLHRTISSWRYWSSDINNFFDQLLFFNWFFKKLKFTRLHLTTEIPSHHATTNFSFFKNEPFPSPWEKVGDQEGLGQTFMDLLNKWCTGCPQVPFPLLLLSRCCSNINILKIWVGAHGLNIFKYLAHDIF